MNRFAARAFAPLATAVLVLIGMAATAPNAAAVTRQHYQQQADIHCPGGCTAKFAKVPAGQFLDIDHVVCNVNTVGQLGLAQLMILPEAEFGMPLGLMWQRKYFGQDIYTVGGEMNVRVTAGHQPEVGMIIDGSPAGDCVITGTRTINN